MLEIIEGRAVDDPVSPIEAYQVVARQHQWLYDMNCGQIRVLSWCLRAATVCLVTEVHAMDRGAREEQAVSRIRSGRKPKPPPKPPLWGDLSLPRD
jgi:hypothetical protein